MNRPSFPVLIRDAIVLIALFILSALAIRETFGTNDVFRFSWLVAGPTVYLVAVRGYRMLGAALVAVILGNLISETTIEIAVWDAIGMVIAFGFGGYIYRSMGNRTLSLIEVRDFFRLLGAALGMGCLASAIAIFQFNAHLPFIEVKSFLQRIAGFAFGFVFTMTPLLVLASWQDRKKELVNRLGDGALIFGLATLVGYVVFLGGFHDSLGLIARGYWMFLFVTLAGLRLGTAGTTLVLLLIAAQGFIGAKLGLGFFSDDIAKTSLSNYYFYMMSLASDGFLVAVLFTQGEQRLQRLENSRQEVDNASAKLRESEQHFRTLANGGTALIWTAGLDKLCNYFNEPWLRYTGRTLEQELGNGWAEGVHPDDFDRCLQIYVSHFDRREPFSMEYRLRMANGEFGWILDQGNPRYDSDGKFIGYIGFCYDITERRLAEEALAQTRNQLEESQKVAHLGRFEYIAATQNTVWSEEEYRIYGLDPTKPPPPYEEMLAKSIHPDDAELLHTTFMKALNNNAVYKLEHRIIRPDGGVRWVYDRAKPYFNAEGKLLRYVGATFDITERKQAEEQLKNQSQRLSLATSSARLGVWDWNVRENTMLWDDRMFELYGITPETFSSTIDAWMSGLHPEDKETTIAECQAALNGEKEFDTIFRVLHPDGTVKYIKANGIVIPGKDGKAERMLGVNADITDQKLSEAELEQHRHHLEELVKTRTLELEQAKEAAETANARQERLPGEYVARDPHTDEWHCWYGEHHAP